MSPYENKVQFLKTSRLFERAPGELVAGCEHVFLQRLYNRGSVLFDQGDMARMVYLLKRGRIRISRRTPDGKEITISILGPGDLFGEEVVFSQATRTTVATCLEDSLLCIARAGDVCGLLNRYPVLALNVAKYLRERLDDALTVNEDVAYLKVSERLTRLLERLAAEHGRPVEGGTLLDVPLTRAEMASLIGTTRETVSAELAQLVRNRRVCLTGKSIVLLEPPSGVPSHIPSVAARIAPRRNRRYGKSSARENESCLTSRRGALPYS
jgi:CRP/FNR family transcriptional regulator